MTAGPAYGGPRGERVVMRYLAPYWRGVVGYGTGRVVCTHSHRSEDAAVRCAGKLKPAGR